MQKGGEIKLNYNQASLNSSQAPTSNNDEAKRT
jgi:hypothetical protein